MDAPKIEMGVNSGRFTKQNVITILLVAGGFITSVIAGMTSLSTSGIDLPTWFGSFMAWLGAMLIVLTSFAEWIRNH